MAYGLGAALGVSVFSAIGPAAALAGPGLLLAVVLAMVPMFFIASAYAFLGAVEPVSGASYEWPRRFLHPALGFAVAWFRIGGNTGAMVVLALVLARYLNMLVPVPEKLVMAALLTAVLLINLFGVAASAVAQRLLMALVLLAFAVFCVWGVASGAADPAHLSLDGTRVSGVFAAVPLLIGLYFGIEAATEVGEEVQDNRRVIPLGIVLSIGSAAIAYLAISAVAIAVLGPGLGTSEAPLLEAAKLFMGPVALPLIVGAAVLAIGKSLNAIFLMFSRSLLAMGRAGALPPAFASVHPRWHTPHVACLGVWVLSMLGILLPGSLTFLFLAVAAPTLFKYASVCLSAARAVRDRPEQAAASGLPLSARAICVMALIGAALAAVVFAIGIGTDWRPYGLLGAWGVIGAAFYLLYARKRERNPS